MKGWILALLAGGIATAASAGTLRVGTDANASHWRVYEISNGKRVYGHPVPASTYGHVQGITFPFTDNDGYWVAEGHFELPADFTSATLHIGRLGVDDRVVVELNGQIVTACGTLASGEGKMTFLDGGRNKPFDFPYKSGAVDVDFQTGFVAGKNTLRLIVNNTGNGIFGVPVPISHGGPTSVGLRGTVTYTEPGAKADPLSAGLH